MEKLFVKAWLLQDSARRVLADRRGATAIEYGLIAAGIAIAIIAAVNTVGTSLSSLFGSISTQLNTAAGS